MTTDVVVSRSQALANLPEHLKDQVGNKAGKEGVGRDDILIPRLCLAQALTPQLSKRSDSYIEDLEVGQFFNSVTGEVYGDEVTIVPLHFFKQYIEFAPRQQSGGLGGIARMYSPGEVPPVADLAFINGNPPKVTEFKNRMAILIREDKVEPIVVSFKSTGLKAARKWNFLIAEKNLPAYAYAYNYTVTEQAKGQQSWYGVDIVRGDFTPAALFQAAEQYFLMLQGAGVQVDVSGLDQDDHSSQDGEASPF